MNCWIKNPWAVHFVRDHDLDFQKNLVSMFSLRWPKGHPFGPTSRDSKRDTPYVTHKKLTEMKLFSSAVLLYDATLVEARQDKW